MVRKRNPPRPRVFIASSAEDLLVASALADHLAADAEIMAWTEDVFTLSQGRLQGVRRVFEAADCAVFVAGAGGGHRRVTLSENLTFELGISIGTLGVDRTMILSDSRARLDLPSDFQGFEYLTYDGSESLERLRSALAAPASKLRRWTRSWGHRSRRSVGRPDPGQLVPDSTFRAASD
jgi:predicted nucleotide-binding protein